VTLEVAPDGALAQAALEQQRGGLDGARGEDHGAGCGDAHAPAACGQGRDAARGATLGVD
jgi:hypothetical protein